MNNKRIGPTSILGFLLVFSLACNIFSAGTEGDEMEAER